MVSAGARKRFWGVAGGSRLCVVMSEHGWQRKRCGMAAHRICVEMLTSEEQLEQRGQHVRAVPA